MGRKLANWITTWHIFLVRSLRSNCVFFSLNAQHPVGSGAPYLFNSCWINNQLSWQTKIFYFSVKYVISLYHCEPCQLVQPLDSSVRKGGSIISPWALGSCHLTAWPWADLLSLQGSFLILVLKYPVALTGKSRLTSCSTQHSAWCLR